MSIRIKGRVCVCVWFRWYLAEKGLGISTRCRLQAPCKFAYLCLSSCPKQYTQKTPNIKGSILLLFFFGKKTQKEEVLKDLHIIFIHNNNNNNNGRTCACARRKETLAQSHQRCVSVLYGQCWFHHDNSSKEEEWLTQYFWAPNFRFQWCNADHKEPKGPTARQTHADCPMRHRTEPLVCDHHRQPKDGNSIYKILHARNWWTLIIINQFVVFQDELLKDPNVCVTMQKGTITLPVDMNNNSSLGLHFVSQT